MDFVGGMNVVYPDGQNKDDMNAANEYLKDIPVSVLGGSALELELSTIGDVGVSLDPRKGSASYNGIENIDSEKYSSNLAISNTKLGKRPMLFIREKLGKKRWVRMFMQPKEKTTD